MVRTADLALRMDPADETTARRFPRQPQALAEVHARGDASQNFVHEAAAAWHKAMNLDRLDLA